jgi:GNAT superfamily N-acetyltransferase
MDQRSTSIRRATAKDAVPIKSLASSLATTFSIDSDAFNEIFERVSNDEGAQIFVSVDERGEINGYLMGFVHDAFFANGAVAWIEEMYVSDLARRRGVGIALERDFETWARGRDAKLIALATRRAASFYLAIGYEESAVYFRKIL